MRDKPIDQHLALRKVARQGKDAGFGVPVTAATLAEEGARPETAITIGACRLVAPRRRRLAVEVGLQNDAPPGIAWFVSLSCQRDDDRVGRSSRRAPVMAPRCADWAIGSPTLSGVHRL